MPLYGLICYFLFGWYIGLQCYLRGSNITSYVGVRDSKGGPIVGQSYEMWIFWTIFVVFGACDRWRGAQDRSWKYGGHHEMAISHKYH